MIVCPDRIQGLATIVLRCPHKFWDGEYVPWEEDNAIVYGEKTRNKVVKYLWPK